MTTPDQLFCWNFQNDDGGWDKGWGGYARKEPITPMDQRERDTGAIFVRRAPAVLAALPEVQELIRAETERCAMVAETEGTYPELNVWGGGPDWYKHGKRIAAVIRGTKP